MRSVTIGFPSRFGRGHSPAVIPAIVILAMLPLSARADGAPSFPGATSQYRAWILARLPGAPEGLAVDPRGVVFASIVQTGEIVRLDGHGGYQRVATVPAADLGGRGMTLGMAFARDGSLLVAYTWTGSRFNNEFDPLHLSCRDSTDVYSGVYRVDVANGGVSPLLTKRDGWPVCFPDDLAIDRNGDVYVTDLTLSGIWKIAAGRKVVLWSADPLLQWPLPPYAAAPEGANDLALDPQEGSLFVVTDGAPALVRIPINRDGSAGKASLAARDLTVLDGVAVDERGNVYVSELLRSEISVFSPDGNQRILIATRQTAPISGPTSLVYYNGVLCAANMGWPIKAGPGTVACLSGFRRPASVYRPRNNNLDPTARR